MLTCEGYKMFFGRATITPVNMRGSFTVIGTWLYKPEYRCWYVNGESYPEEIVSSLVEMEPEEEDGEFDIPF